MFGLGYYRPRSATDYVAKFVGGTKKQEGTGISLWYGPRTTLVRLPTTEEAVTFQFRELTQDAQLLVVQGTCYVRFEPKRLLSRYDFTINPVTGAYKDGEAVERIKTEIRAKLQSFVRAAVQASDLQQHMANTAGLEKAITDATAGSQETFAQLGVMDVRLFISGIEPGNKDLQKALEAKKREELLADADRAQADRHMAAAKNQRERSEYEAATLLTLEGQRSALVTVQNENLILEAKAASEALAQKLVPYNNMEPGKVFALAMLQFAQGENSIGQINISPDLLTAFQTATKGK